jgi:peptidoglycan/xylan/chitin deacetylase (PgdA/CDA1 family)
MSSRWVCGVAAAGTILSATVFCTEAAHAQKAACADKLGVSRTIEVDTTSGPRFGGKKKEFEILEEGEVILTFDDGPIRSHTRAVLAALDAHCTKGTFFLVGRMAVADPDMVKEYDRRGHTVGVHTWSHANLTHLTPLKARHEIELGFSAVQLALGKAPAPFFRFPYLAEPRSMTLHVQGRHVAAFNIDVDSKDYRAHDGATVRNKVMHDLAVTRKGIILFHDIQASTARGLPALLDDLKANNYRIVHMVAKAPATTLPEFDALAEKAMGRRQVASASSPLARRAITWPAVVSPADDKPETPAEARPRRASAQQPATPKAEPAPFDWLNKLFQ